MKIEQNEKKLYMEPKIKVITVDCHDIIATSPGDGEGDDYYHDRLN